MDQLTRHELDSLMDQRGEHLVSVYLPMERGGDRTEANPIRFKNAMRTIEQRLDESGASSDDIEAILKPMRELLDDRRFWKFQSDSFVMFNGPESLAWYRLPMRTGELVQLGDRFHVKPLLSLFSVDGPYAVLALSLDKATLYRGTPWSLTEVDVPGMPAGLDEITQYDHEQKTVRGREGAGSGASTYHGQGRGEESNEAAVREYFHKVDDALKGYFDIPETPLILACVDEHVPVYQDVNSAAKLLYRHIQGNPDHWNLDDLHTLAWKVIEPWFNNKRSTARDHYFEQRSQQRTGESVEDVLKAAQQGRVDTVFVAEDRQVWGHFAEEQGAVQVSGEKRNGEADLLDEAARLTVQHGGDVHVLAEDDVPGDGPIAAIYRF